LDHLGDALAGDAESSADGGVAVSALVGGDEGGSKLAPGGGEVGFLLADALAGLEEAGEEGVVGHGGGFSAFRCLSFSRGNLALDKVRMESYLARWRGVR
jgi:hypothetical protein